MKIKTSAKLNLNLAIKNSEKSSLHRIESLMVPIDLYDEITIDRNIKGADSILFKDNLILSNFSTIHKALFCLRKNTNLDKFFDIRVNKNIPVEAGLGGGSSDAAAVMLSISKLCDLELPAFSIITKEVGSDVPFFINGKTALVKNIGDEIEDYNIVGDMFFLIIVPTFGLSTKAVFDLWDRLQNKDTAVDSFSLTSDINIFNHALELAIKIKPEMKTLKESIEKILDKRLFMTGTGSTLFSIFDSKEEAVEAKSKINIDNRLILVTKKNDYSYKELSD
jgi:4-diphosphocytidyl-2-C-methyl-D-erythritol kinase